MAGKIELLETTACRLYGNIFASCSAPWYSPDFWTSDKAAIFTSTLLGAVVGAISGGLIQATISYLESRRNAKAARKERSRIRQTLATTIAVKTITVLNQLYSVLGLMNGMLENAIEQKYANAKVWEKILPMTGIVVDTVKFDPSELTLLFEAKETDLANAFMLLSEKHFSLMDTIRLYSERRLQFADIAPAEVVPGPENTAAITMLRRRAYELNDIATQLCAAIIEDFEFTLDTVEKMTPSFKRIFKSDEFTTAKVPPGARDRVARFKDLIASQPTAAPSEPLYAGFWKVP